MREAGLSARAEEKLAIKLEIDTHPSGVARRERRIVTRHLTFLLQHYDLPSLLAGKLHAVLTREYAKGRDWYASAGRAQRGIASARPGSDPGRRLIRCGLVA